MRNLVLDGDVPAAHEQRRCRVDLGIEARGDPPLDAAQVRIRRGQVLFARKQQRDVDRHAGEDRLLDRGNACPCSGNLDEQVGASRSRMQSPRFADAARRIVRQQRRHFHRHPTVDAAGRLVGRTEQIRRLRQVFEREIDEQLFAGLPRGRLSANRIVIEAAVTDGVIENRRVGREPGYVEIIDVASQRAVDQHLARDVVEPEALAELVKSLRRFHRCHLVALVAVERRFRSCWRAGCSRRTPVEQREVRRQRAALGARRGPVARAQLVLLRVEVLLAARAARRVLAQLVAGVDAPGRRQRGGQHGADLERGAVRRTAGTRAGCPAC